MVRIICNTAIQANKSDQDPSNNLDDNIDQKPSLKEESISMFDNIDEETIQKMKVKVHILKVPFVSDNRSLLEIQL